MLNKGNTDAIVKAIHLRAYLVAVANRLPAAAELARQALDGLPEKAAFFAAFGLSWLLRAIADLGAVSGGQAWLSWLSPLGWVRLTRAFARERWWVFAFPLGLVVVLVTAAYMLSARRDCRSDSAQPPQRLACAAHWPWHGGCTADAARLGCRGGRLRYLVGRCRPEHAQVCRRSADAGLGNSDGHPCCGDAFLFMIMDILGQVASAYAIAATLRMRSEEVDGCADPVLATPVSRLRWAGSHLFFAVAGPTVMLAVLGLTIGLGYGLGAGDVGHELPRLLTRTMVTVPAVWVMAGLAAALYRLLPRFATAVTWGALAVFLALELGWELQQLSQSLFNISPFAHVHWAIQVTTVSLIGLTVVAAVLTVAGLVGFRRRDVG